VDRAAHPVESQYSGRVVTSALALDREVEAGEVLIELDADMQKLQLTEERTKLGALGPQIQSLEDQIAAEQRASAQEQQTTPNSAWATCSTCMPAGLLQMVGETGWAQKLIKRSRATDPLSRCGGKSIPSLRNRYCSFAYSALACFRMGRSGSASFHNARKP